MTLKGVNILFILLHLLGAEIVLNAQTGARIFDQTGTPIFTIENGKIADTSGYTIYNTRGNIVFKGESQKNEDILYLLKSTDFLSKESGYVYNPSTTKVLFSVKKGKFYFGEGRYSENLAAYLKPISEKQIAIYNGQSDEEIGVIFGGPLANNELAIAFFACMHHFGIDTLFHQSIDVERYLFDSDLLGKMNLTWSGTFADEWIWDGRILKPKWGNRPEDEWLFDGKYLRPFWGTGVMEEWQWENNMLKPTWMDIPELTFIWDGTSIKPFWDYDTNKDWVIEATSARPKWNNDYRLMWQIEGEIPIPLVAIVILGIADR